MTQTPPTDTAAQDERRVKIARQFIGMIPHARELAMQVTDVGPGTAEITMPFDPRLLKTHL